MNVKYFSAGRSAAAAAAGWIGLAAGWLGCGWLADGWQMVGRWLAFALKSHRFKHCL